MHKRKDNKNDNQLDLLPDFRVHVPIVKVPQPGGGVLVVPGKPQILAPEISTHEFSAKTGISQRHVERLCEEGKIKSRRMVPDNLKSKLLIPVTEVERYLSGDPAN
jgi:hypothetical protein